MGQVLPTSMPTQMPTPPQKSPEPVSISTPLFESYNEIYRSKPIDIPKKKPRIPKQPIPIYKYSFNNKSGFVLSFL